MYRKHATVLLGVFIEICLDGITAQSVGSHILKKCSRIIVILKVDNLSARSKFLCTSVHIEGTLHLS